MTESEALEALRACGLRGSARNTDHREWRRLFVQAPEGVQVGRLSLRNGIVESVKWYGLPHDGPIVAHERWAWTWTLWTQRRERLDLRTWNLAVARAVQLARAERNEKQAWRDANPGPKRKPLLLNVRKHLAALLMPT
jgi:hypothetical protein